jgi:ferredoxin-NADP reductase/DMSO/TMAO reductase YedYZ molybdopterin-dependent catalytic subunit
MNQSPILPGFHGRRKTSAEALRIPPGQHLVTDFPVLSAGPTPKADLANWRLALEKDGATLHTWSWNEFCSLPQTRTEVDIHCVTTWSKLDTRWQGVLFDDLLESAGLKEPPSAYAMIHCDGGYTTNVPVVDLRNGKAMVATRFQGAPLDPEHGGPARFLVPHLYFWKSAKWVRRIEFIEENTPGFWEGLGYHIYGDPWREQRYAGLQWQTAEVRKIIAETPRVSTLMLHVEGWRPHLAGQHLDLRLTGEDGYQTQRTYSIASAPEDPVIALTVERITDGEVSGFLVEKSRVGDRFEICGPVGGDFVWAADEGGPLFLIAGGSGIVPLMSMLRHRAAANDKTPTFLLYSSRSAEDIIYREELDRLAANKDGLTIVHTLTRSRPPGWSGGARRIDKEMLGAAGPPVSARPHIYVCGPTQFVEGCATPLHELGHAPERIKTERFGPTGG